MTDFTITAEWIEKFKTPRGAWTRSQIEAVGVDWPPIHGWLRRIIGREITGGNRLIFEARLGQNGKVRPAKGDGAPTPPMPLDVKSAARLLRRKEKRVRKMEARKARRQHYAKEHEATIVARPTTAPRDRAAYHGFYNTPEWRKLRYRAFLVLGRVCACCYSTGDIGKPLHVDHIKPRYSFPDLELVLANLQILCEDCNLGKGAWDETDWRTEEQQEQMGHMKSIKQG